jgi:hypothetical protein
LTVVSLASSAGRLLATAHGQYGSSLYRWVPDSSTWTFANASGECGRGFNVIRARGDSLLAGANRDVCLSLDGGATWKSLWQFQDSSAYIYDLYDDGPFLAALSWSGAAWSDDMGATWTDLPSPGSRVTALARPSDDRLLVGTEGASLWEYFPAGAPPLSIRAVRGARPAMRPFPSIPSFDVLGRRR